MGDEGRANILDLRAKKPLKLLPNLGCVPAKKKSECVCVSATAICSKCVCVCVWCECVCVVSLCVVRVCAAVCWSEYVSVKCEV